MQQKSVKQKIISGNFRKMKYYSLILVAYSIFILITDFAPVNIWHDEFIQVYRVMDIIFAAIAVSSSLFFWFYHKENCKVKDIGVKLVCFLVILWSAVITGTDFTALGFSTLITVMLSTVFFIYSNLATTIVYFVSALTTFLVTVIIREKEIENIQAVLSTILPIIIISTLFSRRNFQNKLTDLAQNAELQMLNNELHAIKDELEDSNIELKSTNDELHSEKKKVEQTLDDLHKTQAQLIQAEKMASLGVLAAGVAHEINNPINFIKSSLEALKSNLEHLSANIESYNSIDEQNYKEKLEAIKKENVSLDDIWRMIEKSIEIMGTGIERATKITLGLKSFVRSGENELTAYSLHQNIENTLLMLYNQYKERIEIDKQYGEIPVITCYPGQINQVLMNLLGNAIQAIEEKGKITITTRPVDDERILLSIKDTGAGIPNEIKEKIFDPFFTTKEVGKGTGLGLSVAYNIIKEHGGKITVESQPGEGSNFVVELPLRQ